jgi:TonB family protein
LSAALPAYGREGIPKREGGGRALRLGSSGCFEPVGEPASNRTCPRANPVTVPLYRAPSGRSESTIITPWSGHAGVTMSEAWKQWEGRIVDGTFPLRQYLGGSEHSAVFLTERGKAAQKAAIKFIQLDETRADLQLSLWRRAAELGHAHLLRVFEFGQCRVDDFDLLYVVTEFANENLSQFLPQRPLTPAEAREVLSPILDALTYLHRESFVHGHLQPSNIFAVEDQVKLSTDGVSEIRAAVSEISDAKETHGETAGAPELAVDSARLVEPACADSITTESVPLLHPTAYHAPEVAQGIVSAAGDIWSLGMTLVEALTQHLPVMPVASLSTRPANPIVPETLPALFLDIVRHCLQHDPARRWSAQEIAARLNPPAAAAATAAATAKASAVSTPAPVAARSAPPVVGTGIAHHAPPVAKPPLQAQSAAQRDHYRRPRYDMALPKLKRPPLLPKMNYFPIISVGVAVIFAVIIVAKLSTHRAPAQQKALAGSAQPAVAKTAPPAAQSKNQPKATAKSTTPATQLTSKQAALNVGALNSTSPKQNPGSAKQTASPEKQSASATSPSNSGVAVKSDVAAAPNTAPALLKEASVPSSPVATAVGERATSGAEKGEVLEQIMPEPSAKAQATIFGKVRVRVKLHVDSSGNVTAADFDSPGPSKYFADLALKAARQWDFAPAKISGHNVDSEWLVRFEFSQTAVKAFPTQATP